MKERGKFIVFEGVGGCGKTTQIGCAKKFLENRGYEVLTTREPGGTESGEKIRNLIFKLKAKNLINSDQQMSLFFASRYLLLNQIIRPNLESGKLVLSDRLHPSTAAYQGFGEGADIEKILATSEVVIEDLRPDAVLLFEVSAETAMRRKADDKEDPFDSLEYDFFERVVNGYSQMAKENWGELPWYKINAENKIEKVTQDMTEVLMEIIETS